MKEVNNMHNVSSKGKNRKELERKWCNHNMDIIQDNLLFGLMHPHDFTKADIKKYEIEANQEQRTFREFIKKGGTPIFDNHTQMYIIPPKEQEKYHEL